MAEQPVAWCVPGWVPADDVTLLAGRRGTGKSSWISRVIAWVTAGRPLAGGHPPPAGNALSLQP